MIRVLFIVQRLNKTLSVIRVLLIVIITSNWHAVYGSIVFLYFGLGCDAKLRPADLCELECYVCHRCEHA